MSSNEDDESLALIPLIPGTNFTVTSGFCNVEINELSKKILRIALALCVCQVILTTVVFSVTLAESGNPLAALRLVDLIFSACLFYLAYSGVQLKNEVFCAPFTHLGGYYFIMAVVLCFELVRLLNAVILVVVTGDLMFLISIGISLLFVTFEAAAIYYVHRLLKTIEAENISEVATTPTNESVPGVDL